MELPCALGSSNCRGCIAGIVNSCVPFSQFKINKAPLTVCTDNVAGIGIPVNNLARKLRIKISECVQLFFAECFRQIQRLFRLGQCPILYRRQQIRFADTVFYSAQGQVKLTDDLSYKPSVSIFKLTGYHLFSRQKAL